MGRVQAIEGRVLTAGAVNTSPPARVPASTIRAIRRFHALDQERFAGIFKVSIRTVIRWEQKGVDPDLLPPGDVDREWRKNLLFWMLGRFNGTGSPDNRPKEGNPTCFTTSTAT